MLEGLPVALLGTFTDPVRAPVAVGENVTVIVQDAPAATTVPQVFFSVREASPLMAIPAIPTELPVPFVTVTFWLGLSPIV